METYLYDKTWDEAAYDPFCILHTSGSTGLPKPIVWSRALIGTMDAALTTTHQRIYIHPPSERREFQEGIYKFTRRAFSNISLIPALGGQVKKYALLIMRPNLPVEKLCAPETSIGSIASLFRESAGRIRPLLVHDAFALLQLVTYYDRLKSAAVGIDGLGVMTSNLMLLPMSALCFGGNYFDDGGAPDTMMPLMGG